MHTAILTDTNSGIPVEEGKQLGIHVLPMPVIIGEKSYLEGVDVTHAQLYEAMKQNRDISSSQPAPGFVTDMWDEILKSGYDEILYIPMSSGLSGSCHNAVQLSAEYGSRVQVVDNHRISFSLRESVLDAKYLSDCGWSAEEIRKKLEDDAYECSIYITVNSLKYLKKSGRITPAAAAIATVINLKPVLTIQGDKLDAFAKVRGIKHSQQKMIDALKNDLDKRFGNIPPEHLQIASAGTFEHPEEAELWRRTVQDAFPEYNVYYTPLSCSIACHVGMDALGIGIAKIEGRS